MRKLIALLLALMIVFTLTACGQKAAPAASNPIKVGAVYNPP